MDNEEFTHKTCKLYELINTMMTDLKEANNQRGIELLDKLRVVLIAQETTLASNNYARV